MSKELIKKLTGKRQEDSELAAAEIINNSDKDAFFELVTQGDFLFDFIKDKVEKRLKNAVNPFNFRNLITFLTVYSPDYEDLIVSSLVRYADEDLTDDMLKLLESGTDEQKAYCAKYFAYVNDTVAIETLRASAYSEFDPLALNSALALSAMDDDFSYKLALDKVNSSDEFERLSAVRFLVTYNNIEAVEVLFDTMKKSSMPENIASEISYLQSFLDFLDGDFKYDTILAINHLINGLGEIVYLDQIFDFQLFEIFSKLIAAQKQERNSKVALVLLNSKLKFDLLTETEEYLFDENNRTKDEVYNIKGLLSSYDIKFWDEQSVLFQSELVEDSDFVYTALELVKDLSLIGSLEKLQALLVTKNQTIILKTVEVLQSLKKLDVVNKEDIFQKISNENIKYILESIFEEL